MRLARDQDHRLNPETIRLPLIALIDVVLFILFYFVISFSASGEERQLGTTLATTGSGTAMLSPQVVQVAWIDDGPRFIVGTQVLSSREALSAVLRELPKPAGLVVRAATDAPIEATAAAVQASRDAGFEKISYAIAGPAPQQPARPQS